MGDVDMVRALALAGVASAYFGPPDYSARFFAPRVGSLALVR
jgi:hypothetical protein